MVIEHFQLHKFLISNYCQNLLGINMILRKNLLNIRVWMYNYGIIKVLLGSFVFYLVIEEFILFLFEKPTQTSFYETPLHSELNPKILICMNPGYDSKGLK